jgi:trans-aconitate 2-methyltransferase
MTTQRREIDSGAVRRFYDDFRDRQMVGYRLRKNRRIERAIDRITPYVGPDSRVLELGCGIGIVTERIAKRLAGGFVWACDLSPKNVEYARETVQSRSTDFFVCDVLEDFQRIQDRVSQPVDLILMVDVIEHLPLERHSDLFASLARISGPRTIAVLTYPSPQYQRFLREHEPENLQIIDEVVELDSLLSAAKQGEFSLRQYALVDVWRHNQYAHCVLQRGIDVDRIEASESAASRTPLRRLYTLIARGLGSLRVRRNETLTDRRGTP